MLDLIVVDGNARGIVVRDLVTGEIQSHTAQAVVLATGGYSNIFYLSTNASGSNVTATYRAWKQGAAFANPCFTQIHPTAIPPSEAYQAKLTLMSESLRNDGRLWVPKQRGEVRPPDEILEEERDYFLERRYPRFGNLAPRDLASRAVKQSATKAAESGPAGMGYIWTSLTPSPSKGSRSSRNATAISSTCINASPAKMPIRRRCASILRRTIRWAGYGSIII